MKAIKYRQHNLHDVNKHLNNEYSIDFTSLRIIAQQTCVIVLRLTGIYCRFKRYLYNVSTNLCTEI